MSLGLTPTSALNIPATPSATKAAVPGAYVDLRDSGWAQQYLPDLMEKEAEVFGNRTISGFLAQVGAEEAMAADQVVWSEQGRLHVSASGTIDASAGVITAANHAVRVNDTVVLNQAAGTLKCLVTAVGVNTATPPVATFTVVPYTQAAMDTTGGTAITFVDNPVTGFVFGSEYKKGTSYDNKGLEPQFASLTNKPAIIKDLYEVSGSDASAIGWIEVSGEEGQNGYLWYLKGNGDTMARFTDYCEMTCIEGELTASGAGTTTDLGAISGTEGLFAAIKARGTVADAGFDSASESLATMDTLLKRFDTQGAIEENMMFLNRETSLAIDDMLASLNGSAQGNGTNANNVGTSFGLFDNSADMALNLGFTGFRRGSYDFYKSDWKYLNDATLRGAFVDVTGVIAPAGTSNVYDQMMGKNMKRPFLHVRYRASQTESRKMKTWITGSVGAATSNLDAMEVNYLSERCLVTQGANNFVLMTK
jgi:hypothetical protein